MPNFDGTGPEGKGSLTGRKEGKCRDNKSQESESTEKEGFISRFTRRRRFNRAEGNIGRGNRGFGRGRGKNRNNA